MKPGPDLLLLYLKEKVRTLCCCRKCPRYKLSLHVLLDAVQDVDVFITMCFSLVGEVGEDGLRVLGHRLLSLLFLHGEKEFTHKTLTHKEFQLTTA